MEYLTFVSIYFVLVRHLVVNAMVPCSVAEHTRLGSTVCKLPNILESDKIKLLSKDTPFSVHHRDHRFLTVSRHIDRERLIHNKQCNPIEWENEKRCFMNVPLVNNIDENNMQFFDAKIEILDINDNSPTFDKSIFEISILENINKGKRYHLPKAKDPDNGINGTITYELKGKDANLFSLEMPTDNRGDLKLKTLTEFDRELQEKLNLILVAKDSGIPPRSSSLQITVNILDQNDNIPKFDNSIERVIHVKESVNNGYKITKITATDKDPHSSVTISIPQSADQIIHKTFDITSENYLVLKRSIDYDKDTVKEYIVPLIAVDSGTPSSTASASLTIRVEDVNDNKPVIKISSLYSQYGRYLIKENKPPETFIMMISAEDIDSENNGEVQCQLRNSPDFALESINKEMSKVRRYKLVSARQFDREMQSNYTILIECTDSGRPPQKTQLYETIFIEDENDNGPDFHMKYIRASVLENQKIGTQVVQLKAKDPDIGNNAQVKYVIHPSYKELFRVEPNSGRVRTMVSFDREKQETVQFVAIAIDAHNNKSSASVTVQVSILDENDCKPIFSGPRIFEIEEGRTGFMGKVEATDNDTGSNGEVMYRLKQSRYPNNYHWTVYQDGSIHLMSKNLDREEAAFHELVVLAIDKGKEANTGNTTVLIKVLDKNDNSPVFINPSGSDAVVNITDKLPIGTVIYTVKAEDKDEGENARIQYSIQSPRQFSQFHMYFAIDENTGEIRLNHSLPLNDRFQRRLAISAKDNGSPNFRQTMCFLTINLVYSKRDGSYGGYDMGSGGTGEGLSRTLTIGLGVSLIILIFACIMLLVGYCCYSLNDLPQDDSRNAQNSSRNSVKKHSESSKFYGIGGFRFNKSKGNESKKDQSATKIEFEPILCTVPGYKPSEGDWKSENGKLDSKLKETGTFLNSEDDNLHPYVQWNQNLNTTYWTYSTGKKREGLPIASPTSDISPYTRLTQGQEPVYQYQTYHIPDGQEQSALSKSITKNESEGSDEVRQILRSNVSPHLANRSQFTTAMNQLGSNSSIYNKENQSKSGTILRHGGYVSGSPCYTSSFV